MVRRRTRWYLRCLEFAILGPLAARKDGRELPLGGAKQRGLLAVLLLRANELVPTPTIIDELWGDQPPTTAVKMVQILVSQLRKVLGDGVIETQPGGYVVRVSPGSLDCQRYEGLLEQGRRLLADGDAERAAELLRQALALWRGPPLADFRYETFARNEIGRLEALRLTGLEQRLEADLALGRHAEAVGELEALVRDQPLRERPRELLMLALYRGGRQADALAVYQETRAALVDEVGLDPGHPLQQLEKAILLQDPSLDLPVRARPAAPPQEAPSRPKVAVPAKERKTVTVLFCEIGTAEELDPESMRIQMSRFLEQAAAVVERHGGKLDNLVGGEGMAVFGVPVVREDDVLRAARAAIGLREVALLADAQLDTASRLLLRIGVSTGEVVTGDQGDVTGGAIAAAKRLAHGAAWGDISLGQTSYAALAHAVEVTQGEPSVFRLDSVYPEATAVPRRDDARFVGRERELERLRDLFAEVVAGGTRLITVVGEPGIGKSRLGREFMAGLRPEARVLVGRCPPYGEGVTFWPLRELLRQAGREGEPSGSSHEVFTTARYLLAELATEQPVVVAFDDIHWAEPTFLDLVEYLAARLGDSRVLLICFARPSLAERRPTWLQPPADTLVLEPLSDANSELLIDSLGVPAAVRARIAETAEGNPLFVEQLAAIADEVTSTVRMPGSIRGVLHERLDRLDREERAVLERAAVAGRSFSFEAVLELSPPDHVEQVHGHLLSLMRKRFIRPDPIALDESFRFQHALIRDATYDGIPKAARADLHEQTAAQLAARGIEHALVGYHLEQTFLLRRDLGSTDLELGARAGHLLRSAAQETFARSDLPASTALLERARVLLPADDDAVPALLTELGYARLKVGDFGRAESDLDDAVNAAARLNDRAAELHALVERQFARSFATSGASADENIQLARDVMAELEEFGDELGLARAWWLKSEGDVLACRWRERAEALEEALEHARRAEAGLDVVSTLTGLLSQALLHGPTPVDEAVARVEELLQSSGDDPALLASVSTSLAGLLAMQGRFDHARHLYLGAVATYEELGLRLRRATQSLVGAQVELLAGDADAAEKELRASTDALGAIGARAFATTHGAMLADVLCTLDRLDEAEELARAVPEAAPEDDLLTQVLWRSALGRVCARAGAIEEGRRLVDEALQLSEGLEFPFLRVAVLSGAAEVEVALSRRSEARRLLEDAHSIMSKKGNVVAQGQIEAALAQLGADLQVDVPEAYIRPTGAQEEADGGG